MCYSRRGKVGYRTKGSTRISMKKPGRPKRPSLEEIEQIKTSRLVGLEKQIVQVLVKLRERRSTLVKKIKEMESMPHVQRLSAKYLEEDLRTRHAEIGRQIHTIQFTPRDKTGNKARKRWLKKMKKAA